jgi:hypothetical protein
MVVQSNEAHTLGIPCIFFFLSSSYIWGVYFKALPLFFFVPAWGPTPHHHHSGTLIEKKELQLLLAAMVQQQQHDRFDVGPLSEWERGSYKAREDAGLVWGRSVPYC